MLSLLLLSLIACEPGPQGEGPTEAIGASEYIPEMWSQRALTVRAGLDEAAALYQEEDREAAQAMVMAVYKGSFEPELEPLIRQGVDPRKAAELEYRFGLVREAMGRRRNEKGVFAAVEALSEQLDRAAAELDRAQAVIE